MESEILVFIHGWASAPEIWQRQREYFCAKESIRRTENRQKVIAEGDFLAKDYEVLTPDIGAAKDITEAAGLIKEAIKGREDFILIGWSLGWLAVLEGLKSFSLKPKGIVAVNSTPKFCSHEYLGAGPTQTHLNKMIRDCKRDPQKTMEDFYKGMLTDRGKNMVSSLQFKNIDYSKLIYGLFILKDVDYRDLLDTIDIPVLIITGSRDIICVPQASEYMRQRIKQSELKTFDCGHLPFLDMADEFNLAIEKFIKKLE